MRFATILWLLASVGLAGCATGSVECSMETPRADCPHDTAGYRAAQEEKKTTETTVTIDDTRCRSFGFEPGSPKYTQCRFNLDKEHQLMGH